MKTPLPPSYSGRLAYLAAIDSSWKPSPRVTLASVTKAMHNFLVADAEDLLFPDSPMIEAEHGSYVSQLNWKLILEDPRAVDLVRELTYWQERYKISSENAWILDAALQTICFTVLRGGKRPSKWFYIPSDTLRPTFAPKLKRAYWLGDDPDNDPDSETWPQFSGRMQKQFLAQLKRYRAEINAISFSEEITPKQRRDAKWLADYTGGESWDKLAEAEGKLGYSRIDWKTKIRVSSHRFAKRIGLNLPEGRAGRRPRLE